MKSIFPKVYVVFFFLMTGSLWAQVFPKELWHDGTLVLENGDTLQGRIKYDLELEALQLLRKNRLNSFTSRLVVSFEIFDETIKDYRKFYSIPYAKAGTYKTPSFFELLTDGQITVLCREHLESKTVQDYYSFYSFTKVVLVTDYFQLNKKGEILPIVDSKKNWLNMMDRYKDPIVEYAKDHKLSFSNKLGLQKIINYYNSLTK